MSQLAPKPWTIHAVLLVGFGPFCNDLFSSEKVLTGALCQRRKTGNQLLGHLKYTAHCFGTVFFVVPVSYFYRSLYDEITIYVNVVLNWHFIT